MRVTCVGHAGLFVETRHGSVLCDPWFNPIFFGSWFPFPDNSGLDLDRITTPDYLYVSHMHDDHYDERFLVEHVSKDAVVILPDYPTSDHRKKLESIGFTRFVETVHDEPAEIDGLRILVHALRAPTDGAIGDSGLALSDGTAAIFDQNDSKPTNLDAIRDFGPFDAHFVQFSGAIWFPMVYRFPAEQKAAFARRKRRNQMARASQFVQEIGAKWFFPFAGPPCFLDEALFPLNDFGGDDTKIFADQHTVIEHTRANGITNGRLMIPGTLIDLHDGACEITHPVPEAEVLRPFVDKERYLRELQARKAGELAAEKASWPKEETDLVAELAAWWEPLLARADHVAAGVGGRVLLQVGDPSNGDAGHSVAIVVDFMDRQVRAWNGEECAYRFYVPRPLVEQCVARREVDWVNGLFLSCRFEAERDGPYNEAVYNWFRSLSEERIAYTEGHYERRKADDETIELDGYQVQRHCPHVGADLARFGSVEDGVLTCALHGWRFELPSGRCLTSEGRDLRCCRAPADEKR